jgi:hypothetical protein
MISIKSRYHLLDQSEQPHLRCSNIDKKLYAISIKRYLQDLDNSNVAISFKASLKLCA